MKINEKKLKRNADIGDFLDLGPVIVMVVSLFGIGIFYAVFRSGARLAAFAVILFGVTFAISFLLYTIGRINRRSAEKAVFNYVDDAVRGVMGKICQSENVEINIDLTIKKPAIVFTLSCGSVNVACDLSPAKRLPSASMIFIAVCMGAAGAEVKSSAEGGKTYKNVLVNVIVNGSPSPAQYFVKDGIVNKDELDNALRIYNNNVKKYKKRKK